MSRVAESTANARMPNSATKFEPLFGWRGAICRSNLPREARHLALVLSLHMNELGGSCFPSLETLASEMACSRSTVYKALDLLTDSGWLAMTSGGGRGKPNSYQAQIPEINRTAVVPFPTKETVPEASVNRTAVIPEDVKPLGRKALPLEAKASKARKSKLNWGKIWVDAGGAPSRVGHACNVCNRAQESYPLPALELAVKRAAEENRSPTAIDLIAHELAGKAKGHQSPFDKAWSSVCRLVAEGRGRQTLDPRSQRAWVACWGEVDGRYVDLNKGGFLKAWRET